MDGLGGGGMLVWTREEDEILFSKVRTAQQVKFYKRKIGILLVIF